uniref:Uncharacterized protein n=1 Tax=Pseudomonas marincola TaxID=437900 RepID=A0A653E8I4_9PSED
MHCNHAARLIRSTEKGLAPRALPALQNTHHMQGFYDYM